MELFTYAKKVVSQLLKLYYNVKSLLIRKEILTKKGSSWTKRFKSQNYSDSQIMRNFRARNPGFVSIGF